MSKLLNFAGFQTGWFACVLSAAAGRPVLGPLVVGAVVTANIVWSVERRALVVLAVLAAVIGYAVDSGLVLGGLMSFPPDARLGGPSTLWMVALWVNLAITLRSSLGWLRGRYALAAVLGAVGGPLAYGAGAGLGAITIAEPMWLALAAVAVAWLAAMPLLLRVDRVTP
jgi:hypothetical protein